MSHPIGYEGFLLYYKRSQTKEEVRPADVSIFPPGFIEACSLPSPLCTIVWLSWCNIWDIWLVLYI